MLRARVFVLVYIHECVCMCAACLSSSLKYVRVRAARKRMVIKSIAWCSRMGVICLRPLLLPVTLSYYSQSSASPGLHRYRYFVTGVTVVTRERV